MAKKAKKKVAKKKVAKKKVAKKKVTVQEFSKNAITGRRKPPKGTDNTGPRKK